MEVCRFTIQGRLDGLNEYTRANRANAYKGNSLKKKNERVVCIGIVEACMQGKLHKIDKYPIELKITWYEPNSRRDIDNITFATKFIQDALVKKEILQNDSQKYISKISHEVTVDKNNPRVEVEIWIQDT